jgi:Protein of unknown function (DUF1091)
VVFEQVNCETNAELVTMNTTIGTSPDGFSTLSADAFVLKSMGKSIMIKNDVYEVYKNRTKLVLSIPKFNYCRLKQIGEHVPYVTGVMKEISRFGNMVQSYPIQPGHYYLHDGFLKDTGLYFDRAMKLGARYIVKCEAVDASKRKPVFIYRITMSAHYEN